MVEQKPPLECFVSCDDVAMVICFFTQTRGGGRMIVKKLCEMGATEVQRSRDNREPEIL